jgi:hypothetical protein
LSSKFPHCARDGAAALLAALCAAASSLGVVAAAQAELPLWRVARVAAADLPCLDARSADAVALLACAERCAPIPWQLDERDARGDFALPHGPQANPDSPPGVLDANDEVLWMAADAGRREMQQAEVPSDASCVVEIRLRSGATTAWVYAVAAPPPAPRSPVRYVAYDAATDTIEAGRVAIGFGAATPRHLALRDRDGRFGPNQLDRLKVRASARFLGIIPLGRDEDDIEWAFGAWHAGPIRVVRREWQWVRLGWGLRTPVFRTESFVYRDTIELPVRLRLNFPPTYFFRAIEVQAALDFRDLRGWGVRTAAAAPTPADDGGARAAPIGEWIALEGPDLTLVLRLQLGDTLSSLHREILYRSGDDAHPPEALPGEHPAIGFRLTEWGGVDRGQHGFTAIAYALPAGYDLGAFAREDSAALTIEVRKRG